MLLRRIMKHFRNENWFAVALDLVVVVLGLFIGLQVDTWWENQKEKSLEVTYLQEIREDFELNRAQLLQSTTRLEEIIQDMLVLAQQSTQDSPSLSVEELNTRFTLVGDMPTFLPVNRAFSNLTGSGDLRLLQSRELKNALANYYAMARLSELVQNTHELELVHTFQPYIINKLDYAAVLPSWTEDLQFATALEQNLILEELHTREFRNIVAQKWNICTDLLDQHRQMLERTEQVLQMLD